MAVYELTDHEYRRALSVNDNVTPWITCNLTNSRVEVDGTYTIIDIPDEDIPAGLFQVRVKAIGDRNASAILSNDVPFTGSVFNFDNGIFPDGVNDYLSVPSLIGHRFDYSFSFGFWIKCNSDTIQSFLAMNTLYSPNNLYRVRAERRGVYCGNKLFYLEITSVGDLQYLHANIDVLNNSVSVYNNGVLLQTDGTDLSYYLTNDLTVFNLLCNEILEEYSFTPMDEVTVYNRLLTPAEISSNYNSGAGENPVAPEDLLLHLKFQEFEMLNFPDGPALGIKDFSGNNNHAKQFNMDTDPLSPNYVLKPFI